MFRYKSGKNGLTITKYTGKANEVQIPVMIQGKPVARIDTRTFKGCKTLTSIHVPSSVRFFSEKAFHHCTSLRSLTIPGNRQDFGMNGLFASCPDLKVIIVK